MIAYELHLTPFQFSVTAYDAKWPVCEITQLWALFRMTAYKNHFL